MRDETRTFLGVAALLILLFAMLILFAFHMKSAFAGVLLPQSRLFNYTPSFWARAFNYYPENYTVKVKVTNQKMVEVEATCQAITLNDKGDYEPLGSSIPVKPSRSWLYPQEVKTFKILFPMKNKQPIMALFIITPTMPEQQKEGVIVLRKSMGYTLAFNVVKGSYNPEIDFKAMRFGENVGATVTNKSKWIVRATISLMEGNRANGTKSFFLEPGKTRQFSIEDAVSNSIILDLEHGSTRYGRKLGTRELAKDSQSKP